MLLEGTIRNGAIVLDQAPTFPEGTRVEVVVKEETATKQPKTLRDVLLQFAGCLSDLPADFAEQHDHYIHGTPKR
ncbi:MAG: hypothetical protein GX575_32300 [Candidatus Anammoximicrobium sp.]|nr:hypothetical protein [Candidatus Anammoximicrobium sp.]